MKKLSLSTFLLSLAIVTGSGAVVASSNNGGPSNFLAKTAAPSNEGSSGAPSAPKKKPNAAASAAAGMMGGQVGVSAPAAAPATTNPNMSYPNYGASDVFLASPHQGKVDRAGKIETESTNPITGSAVSVGSLRARYEQMVKDNSNRPSYRRSLELSTGAPKSPVEPRPSSMSGAMPSGAMRPDDLGTSDIGEHDLNRDMLWKEGEQNLRKHSQPTSPHMSMPNLNRGHSSNHAIGSHRSLPANLDHSPSHDANHASMAATGSSHHSMTSSTSSSNRESMDILPGANTPGVPNAPDSEHMSPHETSSAASDAASVMTTKPDFAAPTFETVLTTQKEQRKKANKGLGFFSGKLLSKVTPVRKKLASQCQESYTLTKQESDKMEKVYKLGKNGIGAKGKNSSQAKITKDSSEVCLNLCGVVPQHKKGKDKEPKYQAYYDYCETTHKLAYMVLAELGA